MNRVEHLFSVVLKVDDVALLKQSVHVLETGFLLCVRVHFSLLLLFRFFDLLEPVDWRVVDILYFVDSDDSHDGPIKAEGVGLVPREHIVLDDFVSFEFKCVWSCNLGRRYDFVNNVPHRLQPVDGATEVEGIVPVELSLAPSELQEGQFERLLHGLLTVPAGVSLNVATQT